MSELAEVTAKLDMLKSLRDTLTYLAAGWDKLGSIGLRDAHNFVLAHGRVYQQADTRPFRPLPKQCFHQAYRLATRKGSKWIYCEGYAINGTVPMPVQHAWVTRADTPRVAYELAWEGECDRAYLGIPYRPEYVKEVYLRGRRLEYGVLWAWWLDCPLLSGDVKLDDVIWQPTGID